VVVVAMGISTRQYIPECFYYRPIGIKSNQKYQQEAIYQALLACFSKFLLGCPLLQIKRLAAQIISSCTDETRKQSSSDYSNDSKRYPTWIRKDSLQPLNET
jgi:hypothetical protein